MFSHAELYSSAYIKEQFFADLNLFGTFQIHRMYRSTGASLAKAQQEFTTEFFRNQHVRSAASNVAAAAVQSQLSQNQAPRY